MYVKVPPSFGVSSATAGTANPIAASKKARAANLLEPYHHFVTPAHGAGLWPVRGQAPVGAHFSHGSRPSRLSGNWISFDGLLFRRSRASGNPGISVTCSGPRFRGGDDVRGLRDWITASFAGM